MTTTRDTVSLPQACVMLRKSREQVTRMIYAGELKATQQDNGRWRITRASVEAHTR